jgi:hypothetical protein
MMMLAGRYYSMIAAYMCLLLLCRPAPFSSMVGADNPTSIVPPLPGPDPGYIIAESDSGLGNRLRVLAAYMYIAENKFSGAHLVFIWDKNEACPGHFLSVLEPIPNVVFATNSSRYVLDKHSKINYENSYAVFSWIMQMNAIPKSRHGLPSWGEIEYRMYSRYFPKRELMYLALEYIERYNICNATAMHIRQTDMALSVERKSHGRKKMSIHGYVKYVESRPVEEPVFLLTDSPKTQSYFLNLFGPKKILVYSLMNETINQLPMNVLSSKNIPNRSENGSLSGLVAEEHRFTTLENTMIDVIIAAHAKEFKLSIFSSLSELVSSMSAIGKRDRGWCSTASTISRYRR